MSSPLAPDEVIRFQDVTKRYLLGSMGSWTGDLREEFLSLLKRMTGLGQRRGEGGLEQVEAVKGVSFSVRQGENLGLIGANGAGKSTILKLVSRITRPTEGDIWVRGRVAALIQVGAGFHRELTGRENVYMYGNILGMTRREVEDRYDEIVAFSGLKDFMDVPVKRYSSGMFVRLGFSVAVYVDPDILIVDEVLAVGDQAFREKCLDRMHTYLEGDTTLIFVSHNRELVESICHRALLLEQGRVLGDGDVGEMLEVYEQTMRVEETGAANLNRFTDGKAPPLVELRRVELVNPAGRTSHQFDEGAPLRVRLHFRTHGEVGGVHFDVRVLRGFTVVFRSKSKDCVPSEPFSAGMDGVAELVLQLHLLRGHYVVSVNALVQRNERTMKVDVVERVLTFRVAAAKACGQGIASLNPRWNITAGAQSGS